MEAIERAEVATPGTRLSESRLASASLRLLSDERLAHLAAAGNRAAFAAIYERHHQALYRYCRTITRNDEDARDALQATMLNAMKAIDTKPRKVRAWLYRIAHNESVSLLRSGKRHSPATLEDVEPSAEAPVESRRELRELLDDIGQLSERQRQALVMRELGGLTYDEVAEALECSPAAAKQAAFDGRTALHQLAEARDTDCEHVRRRISDGDRRLLRGRVIRAHLRSCDPCRRFDQTMQTRQAKLAGLVPALSPAASAAILQSVIGGAGASGTAVGALALGGGGAAAAGGGAAAAGGGLLGGGIAVKGAIAGVAALVATGGAIAIDRERAERVDGGGPAAAEAREATEAPPADRGGNFAAGEAGTTQAAGSGQASGAGANGADAGAQGDNGQGGSASAEETPPEPGAPESQGAHRPPPGDGTHPPRPGGDGSYGGGPRPPRPGGDGTGTAPGPGSGPAPGTRPPGDGQIAPSGADGGTLSGIDRPPRPAGGDGFGDDTLDGTAPRPPREPLPDAG